MTTTETIAAPSNGKTKHGHEDLVVHETTRQVLELKKIGASPMNPRKTFDERDIKELSESIRAKGLAVPLLVRPRPSKGAYELVFGERRHRALTLLGETHVSCDVRELSDDQVRELMLSEFLHRKDLEPLEEAEAFAALQSDRKCSVPELAVLVSKSEPYVRRRLVLNDLSTKARQELRHRRLLLGAAEHLARLEDTATQDRILPQLVSNDHGAQSASADRARNLVLEQMRVLTRAPWDPKDKDLVAAAGACLVCPKRTDAQRSMFDDPKSDDRCTDSKCWDGKLKAHSKGLLATAKAKGLPIVDNLPKDTWEPDYASAGERLRLAHNAAYIDVANTALVGTTHRPWKDLVKQGSLKVLTCVDSNGHGHEVLDRKIAESYLRGLQPKKRESGSSSRSSSTRSSGSSDTESDAVFIDAHVAAVVAKAEKASASVMMRIAIDDLLQAGACNPDNVISRRCWKASGNAGKTIRAAADKMQLEQLQGLFAEMLVSEDLEHLDEVLKIDAKAIEKKVRDELKATEAKKNTAAPASPAKSAKAPPKKKAAKKGGKR